MNFTNFQTLKTQNTQLKNELAHLQQHKQNLETILNQITQAKAFKLLQRYCKLIKLKIKKVNYDLS